VVEKTGSTRPARRSARPRQGRRLPGRWLADRLSLSSSCLLRLLDELHDAERTPVVSGVEILGGMRHLLLVTFRRDGGRVATPVWVAAHDGRLYARTQRASGKVKRVRNNAYVLLAPCTTRGRPFGAAVPGMARVLSSAQESTAEAALREKYGFIRAACATVQDWLRVDMCYLEVTLAESSSGRQTSA
jgi:uncharacterized protein